MQSPLPLQPHAPPTQASPLGLLAQSLPQAPQLVAVVRSVSQPSSAFGKEGSTQLPQPALQVGVQSAPLHTSTATLVLLHARPQPPQLKMLALMLVSQPSSADG